MRGTEVPTGEDLSLVRFIPACAGNRHIVRNPRKQKKVHPRVCGEQKLFLDVGSVASGSSPRVRGTVATFYAPIQSLRFIPACAGNRQEEPNCILSVAVHPRVCGEQSILMESTFRLAGSSPRVRGTGCLHLPLPRQPRFIPACAGNRESDQPSRNRRPVHPRVCGEQYGYDTSRFCDNGSSPRVRGTGAICRHRTDVRRFIPACAGNSTQLMYCI